jgi:hypothetical protein
MFLKDSMQRMTSTGAMESASIIARATARSLDEGIALKPSRMEIGRSATLPTHMLYYPFVLLPIMIGTWPAKRYTSRHYNCNPLLSLGERSVNHGRGEPKDGMQV